MKIREIEPGDIPDLFAVRVVTRENTLSREELAALGITEASILAVLGTAHRGWAGVVEDRIVGFAMGDRTSGEMTVIAMLPEHEGRGIGAALLVRVEDWLFAEGWDEIWLTTDEDTSLRAYGFYRKLGWVDDRIEAGNRYMKKSRPAGF
jgi:ribosomal protein S18 acetylase RimI-like enzyme